MLKINDKDLYKLCKKYGKEALQWRRKFIGLLPEVFRRKLYARKGFSSIYEFASRLAGVSNDQVRLVLNLERRFEDKPALQNLLVKGEVSASKLERVAFVATKENEEFWASQAQLLSKSALNTLVRDERQIVAEDNLQNSSSESLFGEGIFPEKVSENKDTNGSNKTNLDSQFTSGRESKLTQKQEITYIPNFNINDFLSLALDKSTIEKLKLLKSKGFDLNQLISELLEKRKDEIVEGKARIEEKELARCHVELVSGSSPTNQTIKIPDQVRDDISKPSRYIPARTRKLLIQEFGKKCAVPTCKKPSQNVHHTSRFSISHSHNPHFLAPLCKEHHEVAHSVDLKVHQHKYSNAIIARS